MPPFAEAACKEYGVVEVLFPIGQYKLTLEMKLKSLKSQNDITKTIRERKLRHKATWTINNGQNKVQMELAIRIFFSHAHFGFGFANMRMGILPNLKKNKYVHIQCFPLLLYQKYPFLPQKWYFCIGNGIYDPKLTHFGQLSAAQDNQPTHIWVFQFVSAAGAVVVIITV